MVRQGLTPILFVLSNDGYEIERQIHGPRRKYNDVAPYDHSKLFDLFAGKAHTGQSHDGDRKPSATKYHAVRTKNELDSLLKDVSYVLRQSSAILRPLDRSPCLFLFAIAA